MGVMSWLRATLSARAARQNPLGERGLSIDDEGLSHALEAAMAMEQSQRLMRRWDRHWCVACALRALFPPLCNNAGCQLTHIANRRSGV